MWHIILLEDKWAVFVWSKIRSAENNQSFKEPGKRNELWVLVPLLVFRNSALAFQGPTGVSDVLCSLTSCTPGRGRDAQMQRKYSAESYLYSKLVRWCKCQSPASCDTHPNPHPHPLQEQRCFWCTTKWETDACVLFFIGDLSVSWLSSHNKSPALSWGWTLGASGGRRMTCRPLKSSGSSDGSAVLTENIHNRATNNENIKHSSHLTGWQKQPGHASIIRSDVTLTISPLWYSPQPLCLHQVHIRQRRPESSVCFLSPDW